MAQIRPNVDFSDNQVLHRTKLTYSVTMMLHTIEVFKTNVTREYQASIIVANLMQRFPGCRINFDLDDCDRILRIEGPDFCATKVIALLQQKGFSCSILE